MKEHLLNEKETSLDTEFIIKGCSKGDLLPTENLRHAGEREIDFHCGSKGAACLHSHLVRAKAVVEDRVKRASGKKPHKHATKRT